MTVQRALEQLARDGFTVSRGKRGTFVHEHPPHLYRYGVMLPIAHDEVGTADQFGRILYQEALRRQHRGDRHLTLYQSAAGYQQMLADFHAQRLAGLILHVPWHVANLPSVWQEVGLPVIGFGKTPPVPGMKMVDFDIWAVIHRALEALAGQGRRRVAVLLNGGDASFVNRITVALANRGMASDAHWVQFAPSAAPIAARHVVRLFMEARERPDALLICDDSLVESATAGLLESGVWAPGELEVIGHCNFPYPTPSHVPLRRLGFDVREILRVSLDLIDRCRRKEQAPVVTEVAPVFEEEVGKQMSALEVVR